MDHDSYYCYALCFDVLWMQNRQTKKQIEFFEKEEDEESVLENDKNRLDENERVFVRRDRKIAVRWRFSASHFALISHWYTRSHRLTRTRSAKWKYFISIKQKKMRQLFLYSGFVGRQGLKGECKPKVNEVMRWCVCLLDQLSYQSNIAGTLHFNEITQFANSLYINDLF